MTSVIAQSRWLPFFAELSSKVGHHKAIVVVEGCYLLQRLLATRLSVVAFLEEGHVLGRLLDALIASLRPIPDDARRGTHDFLAVESLIQVVEDVADLAASLVRDSGAHRLLVNARAAAVLKTLTVCLGNHACRMPVHYRLTELRRRWSALWTDPSTHEPSPFASRHVTALESLSEQARNEIGRIEDASHNSSTTSAAFNVDEAVGALKTASDHKTFIAALDQLWSASSECSSVVGLSESIERICSTLPHSPDDIALLRAMCRFLIRCLHWRHEEGAPGIMANVATKFASSVGSAPAEAASDMMAVVRCYANSCDPCQARALKFYGALCQIVSPIIAHAAETCSSALIDAPVSLDGALGDDTYLACALNACREATATVAVYTMSALCDFVWFHGAMIAERAQAATITLLQSTAMDLLSIAMNNPTMSRGLNTLSSIHTIPRCTYEPRHFSIGEASVVTLTTALGLGDAFCFDLFDRPMVSAKLPRVILVTRNSIHDYVRALPYRIVSHITASYSQFVSINSDHPSMLARAVDIVVNDAKLRCSDPEFAGACMWLAKVLWISNSELSLCALDLLSAHAEIPRRLLGMLATESHSAAKTRSIALLLIRVSREQRRLGHPSVNALAPYGKDSLALWVSALQHQAARLADWETRVESDSGGPNQAAALEDEAVALYAGTAVLAEAWCLFAEEFVDLLSGVDQNDICAFAAKAIGVTRPNALIDVLHRCFRGSVCRRTQELREAFNACVAWSAKALRVFFQLEGTTVFAPLEAELVRALVVALQCTEVGRSEKSSLGALIRILVQLEQQHAPLRQSIEKHAADIFTATCDAPDDASTTALRCILVNRFVAANHAAAQSGWFSGQVRKLKEELEILLCDDNSGRQALVQQLSLVVSHVSNIAAFPLQKFDAQTIVGTLLTLSKGGASSATHRTLFVRACTALGNSAEGRYLLQQESSTTKSVEERSCLGRLIALAFSNVSSPELACSALDAITSVCRHGDEQSAATTVKMRVIDLLYQRLLESCRRGRPASAQQVAFLRFLAAASLATPVQTAIFRIPDLVTILIENARGTTNEATLALMTLRNLALNPNAKLQMTQDSRLLALLKSSLWMLDDGEDTEPSRKGQHVAATTLAANAAVNRYRRQQLAGTAMWSMAHNNQRAKGYLRGVMRCAPSCNLPSLSQQVDSVDHLVMLPEYSRAMKSVVQALEQLGVSA